ncbi:L-arabinose isomerase [Paxillus involutus ATCC 200175]|uniref:L-arabinose isomerase n=1 Tax=Paxillus involutus ATCC 200175 TaxID=664439 RepID=A0A0C9TG09_PAXIN|nr:L-arabinose isomerase [Paxillus involutus ATCC 200175]
MQSYSARIAGNPYIVGSFAYIGGGLFGLDISSMSGVLNNQAYFNVFKNPGSNAQGAIVASMPAGSIVGSLAVTSLTDRIGRKNTIILASAIWVLGGVTQCAAINRGMLVVGRVIAGISVGLSSTVVPIYQSEIAAPSTRGRIVCMQQWLITWDIMLQYFVQFGCLYINGNASFRIPWGLQIIPAIVLGIGMLWFPESPRWLIDNGREEALQILADLHGKGDRSNGLVVLEFEQIKEQVDFERNEGAKSYVDLLKPGVFRRVGLGCSLQMWSPLSGMNVMRAGLTGRRVNLIADSVQYVLNVAFTVPAILYIDRWGRRPLLISGSILMGFFLCLVGGLQAEYGEWGTVDGSSVWVIINHGSVTKAIFVFVCSYLFVSSFAGTIGPVSWTYPAEIFPMKVRAKAVSLATATNWLFNLAIAWAVPPALFSIAWKTYFVFAAFNFAAAVHFTFCFPETAQHTLEEIEEVFWQGHTFSAWAISRDVGKRNLEDLVKGRVDDEKQGSLEKAQIFG